MAKPEKINPQPLPCVCDRGGIIVKSRSGNMVTCPNPVRCEANLRTSWHSHEESAIAEWNGLVRGWRNRNERIT